MNQSNLLKLAFAMSHAQDLRTGPATTATNGRVFNTNDGNPLYNNRFGSTVRNIMGNDNAIRLSRLATRLGNKPNRYESRDSSFIGRTAGRAADAFKNSISTPWRHAKSFAEGFQQGNQFNGMERGSADNSRHMLQGMKDLSLTDYSFGTNLSNAANNVQHGAMNLLTAASPMFGGQQATQGLGRRYGGAFYKMKDLFGANTDSIVNSTTGARNKGWTSPTQQQPTASAPKPPQMIPNSPMKPAGTPYFDPTKVNTMGDFWRQNGDTGLVNKYQNQPKVLPYGVENPYYSTNVYGVPIHNIAMARHN